MTGLLVLLLMAADLDAGKKVLQAEISEDQIRNFMKQWLESQNRGDFLAYQRLYAERFTGVRRSGPRTVSLDRKGWMRDRERMFAKPMQVVANKLKSSISGMTAIVQFEQSWATPGYRDVGPKQLILIREKDGALRITREEMLASKKIEAGRDDDFSFLYILEKEGIVLSTNPSLEWGTGPIQLVSWGVARRHVNRKSLPVGIKGLEGKSFKLMNSSGEVCETKITGFFLLKKFAPHFGMVQRWQGEWVNDDGKKEKPPSRETIASEIWDMGEEGFFLVGSAKICSGAAYARLASLSPPMLVPAKPASAEWRETALQQLRRLPAYKKIQEDYEQQEDDPHSDIKRRGRWEEWEGARPVVLMLSFPEKQDSWISVSARSGAGCGGFAGEIWALWEVHGDASHAQFKPLNEPEDFFYLEPEAAVDLDGDHHFEVFYGQPAVEGILYEKDGLIQEKEELEIPDYDCPC